MSLHEYEISKQLTGEDYPFYALIFAAFRQADTRNLHALKYIFPERYEEFERRYNAPGGILEGDL